MKQLFNYCLVAVAALLPTYLVRFDIAGIPTNGLEVCILILFLLGVSIPSVRQQWIQAYQEMPRAVGILALLFVVAASVSVSISPHQETSLGILKGWIIIPLLYAAPVYAATRETRVSHRVIKALIASGVVMALFSFSQFGALDRIQGVYDVPNSLALFLAPLIILAAVHYFRTQVRWYSLAAGIMFVALLGTQSIGGILVTLVTVGLYLVWNRKRAFLFILIVLGVVLVSLPKIQYLVQPASSAAVRLQLWDVSAELIREHPLLGIGLGVFEPLYQQKLHERFAEPASAPLPEFVFRDPHNWILSFWLNTGLLGLLSFAALHGLLFARTQKLQPVHYVLLTLLLFGLVDTIYWKNDLATLHWMLIALVARELQDPEARSQIAD